MAGGLSDKGIAVFAFAAYHQLTSGEVVKEVVLADGKGHEADPQAIAELKDAGLGEPDAHRMTFTEAGQAKLADVLEALRKVAG